MPLAIPTARNARLTAAQAALWACAAAFAALAAKILAATLSAAFVAHAALAGPAATPVAALAAAAEKLAAALAALALSKRRSAALSQSRRRSTARLGAPLVHDGSDHTVVERQPLREKFLEHHLELAGLHRCKIILPNAPNYF